MKTIGVDLWGDQIRGGGHNNVTCLRPATRPKVRRSFRELFVGAYPSFAARCREVSEPGIALVAVDETTGRAMGIVRLLARVQRHVAAIIGRHDECDLFLNAHARLALRHLAVILDPVADWRAGANVRYRVLDLRTTDGFTDENDRQLRGLRCEGPGLLRCGGYALFIIPLGDPTDWPTSAEDAWAFLPERVYFDELDRAALGSVRRFPGRTPTGSEPPVGGGRAQDGQGSIGEGRASVGTPATGRGPLGSVGDSRVGVGTPTGLPAGLAAGSTGDNRAGTSMVLPVGRGSSVAPINSAVTQRSLIISTHGPRDTTGGSLVESGDLAGTLELIGPRNRGTIRIGHNELHDGVLLGRYARCNNAQLADDPSLSRVHALLIQIDNAIIAVDTASLNGIREAEHPKSRVIQLFGDTELVLGTATRARWHWVS